MSGRDVAAAPLGSVQRDLAGAGDEQIRRVVGMVDAMAERGTADTLIAPLRARLRQIRPPRPLSLPRVLLAPLEPLLVAAPAWRRGQPALPRTALRPLAGVVQRGLDAAAAGAVTARVAGCRADDAKALAEAGALLWPRAALLVEAAAAPEDWNQATGLPDTDFDTLARAIAVILAHASTLQALVSRAQSGCDPDTAELEALLIAAGQAGPEALAMMATLLMARLPRAERMLQLADDHAARQADPAAKKAVELAVTFLLDSIQSGQPPGPLSSAAVGLDRLVGLLADLTSNAAQRPSRRVRVDEIRRKIDSDCRERFAADLDAQLLAPATEMGSADNAALAALEATARDLRRFEASARRIGGGDHYDRQLKQAAEALRAPPGAGRSGLVDRARLVEILQGAEAAAVMLAN